MTLSGRDSLRLGCLYLVADLPKKFLWPDPFRLEPDQHLFGERHAPRWIRRISKLAVQKMPLELDLAALHETTGATSLHAGPSLLPLSDDRARH